MALKPLSADMDNIQKLIIPGLDTDMDVIQKLDDEPNDVGGLSPAQLKAEFDKAGNIIKAYLNETLLPAISETVVEAEIRAEKEAERLAAEAERIAAELERVQAETGRTEAEDERVTAENLRAAEEELRVQAEALRVQAEELRAAAERGREEAEQEREAAEAARADEHTGLVAQVREQADRAQFEADRAHQIAGGDVVTYLELENYLLRRAAIPLIGPAALAAELGPGGILFVTDDGDPAAYLVTMEQILAEGDKAATGQVDTLETLLTAETAGALNLKKNSAGESYTQEDMAGLRTAIRTMCTLALSDGTYVVAEKTALSYRQVQWYLLHGELVSHVDTYAEDWAWSLREPESEHLQIRQEIAELKDLIGDANMALDAILEGDGEETPENGGGN